VDKLQFFFIFISHNASYAVIYVDRLLGFWQIHCVVGYLLVTAGS